MGAVCVSVCSDARELTLYSKQEGDKMKATDIQNVLFETDVNLDKARFTAEMVNNELTDLVKIVKDTIGGYSERLLAGMGIILDYLGEVQGGIDKANKMLEEMREK